MQRVSRTMLLIAGPLFCVAIIISFIALAAIGLILGLSQSDCSACRVISLGILIALVAAGIAVVLSVFAYSRGMWKLSAAGSGLVVAHGALATVIFCVIAASLFMPLGTQWFSESVSTPIDRARVDQQMADKLEVTKNPGILSDRSVYLQNLRIYGVSVKEPVARIPTTYCAPVGVVDRPIHEAEWHCEGGWGFSIRGDKVDGLVILEPKLKELGIDSCETMYQVITVKAADRFCDWETGPGLAAVLYSLE